MKLSNSELMTIFYQLSVVFSSGMSFGEGLSILKEDSSHPALFTSMYDIVESGTTFTAAAAEVGVFPPYALETISIAEETGRLPEGLYDLSEYYRSLNELGRKLRDAIKYPAVLILLMLAVIALIVVKILPTFHEILASYGAEIPPATRALFTMGKWVESGAIYLLAALAFIVLGFYLAFKNKRTRSKLLLKLPVVSRIYKKFILVKTTKALGNLVRSGYPLPIALEKVLPVLEDPNLEELITKASLDIESGVPAREALDNTGLFPLLYLKMLDIGVKSGKLEEVLVKSDDIYSKELSEDLANTTASVEPVIVTILSVVVGIILLLVMLPIISIMSSIG